MQFWRLQRIRWLHFFSDCNCGFIVVAALGELRKACLECSTHGQQMECLRSNFRVVEANVGDLGRSELELCIKSGRLIAENGAFSAIARTTSRNGFRANFSGQRNTFLDCYGIWSPSSVVGIGNDSDQSKLHNSANSTNLNTHSARLRIYTRMR